MITLQQFTENDFEKVISWVDSEQFLVQFAGTQFLYPLTTDQLKKYLDATDRKIFKIILDDTQSMVGMIDLSSIDLKNRSAILARVLIGERTLRGKGFGNEAIITTLRYGFEELGLHRIAINVLDFNKGAIELYKHLGFQQEGYLRDYFRIRGTYWSVYRMSILEDEFKKFHTKA